MKTVYVVFRCDEHHSFNSFRYSGVFTVLKKAIEQIKESIEDFTDDDFINLFEKNQTQGREENYVIQESFLNQKLQ